MVRQTQGDILDMVLGTDVDLNQFLLQDRQTLRPMEGYTEGIDFLEADNFTPEDELEVGNMVTIGEDGKTCLSRCIT